MLYDFRQVFPGGIYGYFLTPNISSCQSALVTDVVDYTEGAYLWVFLLFIGLVCGGGGKPGLLRGDLSLGA